jgi:hypothetical protein
MTFSIPKRPRTCLLGLTLDGRRLEGVVLRRVPGALRVERLFAASLSLDPLTNDPELVGREIRNHLDEAGVRESRCAVGLPLNWVLTLQTKLPDIAEADQASFLSIQTERGFPYGPEDLLMGASPFQLPNGDRFVTTVAIPRNHLTLLERVLIAARLKPVAFSLAIAALQPPGRPTTKPVLALLVGETGVDLQVTGGGGVVVLRSLSGAIEMDGARRRIDTDLLIRDIRLTLGQLPGDLRESLTALRVFGRPEWQQPLAAELAPHAQRMGLQVETRPVQQADGLDPVVSAAPDQGSPALVLAARCLARNTTGFEFLPPKVSAWQQVATRLSSRKILAVGATAGAVLVVAAGAFLIQAWRLSRLEARWRAIAPGVTQLQAIQDNIRQFRPWFDDSHRSLTILRSLTEVFPEEGVIWLRTLTIKNLSEIACTGTARDNQSWLRMLDRLHAANHIQDVKVEQVNGRAPLQFSFGFRWQEEGSREN